MATLRMVPVARPSFDLDEPETIPVQRKLRFDDAATRVDPLLRKIRLPKDPAPPRREVLTPRRICDVAPTKLSPRIVTTRDLERTARFNAICKLAFMAIMALAVATVAKSVLSGLNKSVDDNMQLGAHAE